jgi:hypothetical protein
VWLAVFVASTALVYTADEPSPAYADKLNLKVVLGADGVAMWPLLNAPSVCRIKSPDTAASGEPCP